jgi:uncharacterized repeat protein (TIGR03803 family)
MSKLSRWMKACGVLLLWATAAVALPAQTFTTLYNFCSQTNCTDGRNPYAELIQATDGKFYGTTLVGGPHNPSCSGGFGCGTVFKMTPAGTLTTLHSFDNTDGAFPYAGLVQGANGQFYGTTATDGANGDGTVFKMTPSGTLTTLHNFDNTDGSYPEARLVQATDGNFYGTTLNGGANGKGTVFKMTPAGTLTTLHSFDGTDGEGPQGLVLASNGKVYGTTSGGGANGDGTAFSITPNGTLTTLHNFDGTDGISINTLIQGQWLCSQRYCADGSYPEAGLVQSTNGKFYGTASGGLVGAQGDGTVFSLSVGLGPFVETQPTSGMVGTAVTILGTKLTGATSVTFGGIAATFTVVSPSEITTTVPAGALTGSVNVTVGATTLTSAQTFRVTPTIASFSPPSGPVGTSVTITGTGLTQTSKLTFNGTVATTFMANSDTQVTATVPTGATTDKIEITTPGGTAKSATSFTVN